MDSKVVLEHINVTETPELNDFISKYFNGDTISINDIANPKAILKWVEVQQVTDSSVTIEGHTFNSILLADKLKNEKKVILLVATSGTELYDYDKIEEQFTADYLGGFCINSAIMFAMEYAEKNLGFKDSGLLQPGSLPDWPIENNIKLLELIGDVEKDCGITLTEAGYMKPWNSISGILFSGSGSYQNCSLCKRGECVGRRAPFDENEYKRIFG